MFSVCIYNIDEVGEENVTYKFQNEGKFCYFFIVFGTIFP